MRRIVLASVIVLGISAVGSSALAFSGLVDSFTAQYPSATRLASCGTCHTDFQSPSATLNPYGSAFSEAGGLGDPAAAMTAIEATDSDGDGTTNGEEINTATGFLPGFTCDTAGTAGNAPSDILDFVDPTDIGCTGATTTTVPVTTTVPATTTTTGGVTTTTTTGGTTTTTVPGEPKCSQPVTNGANPTASDCLFILRAAVGSSTCAPACICDVNSAGGTTATDALVCLKKAVGQNVELVCPCGGGTTTTSVPGTTSTTVPVTTTTIGGSTTTTTGATTTTTTGGGSIAAGQAQYDSRCSFCHGAGSYDPNIEFANDLANKGDNLVADLGTIDPSMNGITLTNQQMLDLAAFLNSL